MEKSFLAALPPELRQRVYQHLFPKDQVYHIIQHRRSKFRDFDAVLEGTEKNFPLEFNYSVCSSSTVLGGDSCRCGSSAFKTTPESFATFRRAAFKVLLTCRQLYCECWEIAYGNSIFAFNGICIESITNVMAFLRSIGPRSLSRVRHLQVEMQVRKPGPGTAHETMHSMDPDAVVVVAREFEHLLLQSQVRDLLLRVHLWNESPRHAIAWHFVRAIAELNLTTHFIKNLDITFETPQTTSFTVPYWPTHELQGWNCPSPATYYQDRRISRSGRNGIPPDFPVRKDGQGKIVLFEETCLSEHGTQTTLSMKTSKYTTYIRRIELTTGQIQEFIDVVEL